MVAVTKAYREPSGGGSPGSVSLGSVVQKLTYDGTGRRIVQQVQNSAPLNATYHYYYDGQSVIEVRNGSDLVLKQQVWGNLAGGYVDELVQIGMNDDPTDGGEDDVESFYWAMQDANYNLLGLIDENGILVERYEYTPYGERTVYFSPGVNDTGLHAPTTTSRRWALAGDGTGSFADGQPYALSEVGHQGLHHDEVTGLVYNRARMLHPRLGRFMQRDPLGYVDGMGLYAYYAGMHGGLDPLGLEWDPDLPNWHHMVPQALHNELGDVIHDPDFGWFMRAEDHAALHEGGQWNRNWDNWLNEFKNDNGRLPNKDELVEQCNVMKNSDRYKDIIDRGFRTRVPYRGPNSWTSRTQRLNQLKVAVRNRLARLAGKKTGKGIAGAIPGISLVISLWDYPARSDQYGGWAAAGMTVVDNIPIADWALAGAEGIDQYQEAQRQAEAELRREMERMIEEAKADCDECE